MGIPRDNVIFETFGRDLPSPAPSSSGVEAALASARTLIGRAATLLPPAVLADGAWNEEDHPRASDGKFGEGDGARSDGEKPERDIAAEAKAAKLNPEMAQYAADRGIPLAEFKEALKEVPEAKAAMRAEAKAMQIEVANRLDQIHCGKEQFPRPPKDVMTSKHGEWDWYKALPANQRQHLQMFFEPTTNVNEGRSGLDVKLAEARYNGSGPAEIQNMNPDEFGAYFHGLATQYLDYGLMAQGKAPAYGEAKDMLPGMRETGIDPNMLFGSDKARAAEGVWAGRQNVAEHDASREADHAFSLLGSSTHYASEGSAPWQMGYQSWSAEVLDLDYKASTGSATKEETDRLAALIPPELDAPAMALEDLYASIVETARSAGMEVPEHARIPW